MVKLSNLAVDSTASEEGVWAEYEAGIEFKIARLGNPRYQQELARLIGRLSKRGQRDWAGERLEKAQRPAVARHIIRDWRNVDDDDGNTIPYSPEKALEIISDPQYQPIYDWIMQVAQDEEEYRLSRVEEQAGNSNGTSSGN